jgi:hypothetical protein
MAGFELLLAGESAKLQLQPATWQPNHLNSCFAGTAKVLLEGGLVSKHAANLVVGESLFSTNGCVKVLARISTPHRVRPHPVVKIGDLLITQRHPIQIDGEWVQPGALTKPQSGNSSTTAQMHSFVGFTVSS